MKNTLKIAMVGTGGMAHAHARDVQQNPRTRLVAVADADVAKARAFAAKFGVEHAYESLDEMLAGASFDALINVTPDAFHAPLTLAAITAGKHVLCEKPLATQYRDAKKMADAAQRKGVAHLVNFSYRNSPAIQRAHQMVIRGDIGRPVHFEASYLQSWLSTLVWGNWRTSPAWLWRLSTKHGSQGALGDIGVHILDFAAFPLGPFASVGCRLHTIDKAPGARVGEYTLDANDSAVIHATMANGAAGVVHASRWATGHSNSLRLRIYGEAGGLVIDLDKGYDRIDVCLGRNRHKSIWKTVVCPKTPSNFERFLKSIRTGKNEQPDFFQGAAIQRVMDACFASDRKGKTVNIAD